MLTGSNVMAHYVVLYISGDLDLGEIFSKVLQALRVVKKTLGSFLKLGGFLVRNLHETVNLFLSNKLMRKIELGLNNIY